MARGNDYTEREETIDFSPSIASRLRSWWYLCLSYWPWFLVSVVICMGLAALYLFRTPKSHRASVSILLVNSDKKQESGVDKTRSELGIDESVSNISNELLSLTTTDMGLEVARRLNLNVDYAHQGRIHEEVAYGPSLPIIVRFDSIDPAASASLRVAVKRDKAVLSEFVLDGQPIQSRAIAVPLGAPCATPLGMITVEPSKYYRPGIFDELIVRRVPMELAGTRIAHGLSADIRSKNSTIVDITYSDISLQRAKDILATVIAVYNENWVKEKMRVSDITDTFIRDRLGIITDELGNVDNSISSYKSSTLTPNVQQAGSMAMDQAQQSSRMARELAGKIAVARSLLASFQTAGENPVSISSGLSMPLLEQQVTAYNNLLMKRNKHLAVTSESNPMVVDLSQNLVAMRQAIIMTLSGEIENLQQQYAAAVSGRSIAHARIAANPQQEKYLLNVERQQKVMEELYLFLLQKREENELTQAFTPTETKVVERPHPVGGTFPDNTSTMALAFLVGLLIPGAIVFGMENLNTTIRSRKDIEEMKTPFLGEIPLAEGTEPLKRGLGKRKTKKQKGHAHCPLVVGVDNRDAINEAFRVVRSNLQFITSFDAERRIVLFTSVEPDSGKTFLVKNMAETIGLASMSVVAVDLDMRKATLSKNLGNPEIGVANYLSGQEHDLTRIISHTDHFDYIPVGALPPNPTELLSRPRLQTLFDTLGEDYDFVLVDCPPVEIVADVNIIRKYVDATVFVLRAGLFDRNFLNSIEKWNREERFPNMSILLNGTTPRYAGYGNYRYGYKYGYGYYGYGNDKKS